MAKQVRLWKEAKVWAPRVWKKLLKAYLFKIPSTLVLKAQSPRRGQRDCFPVAVKAGMQ